MKAKNFLTTGLVLLATFSSVVKAQVAATDPLINQVSHLLIETNKQGLVKAKYASAETRLADLIKAGRSDEARKQMSDLISKIASDLATGQVKADDLKNRSIVTAKKLQKAQLEAVNQYVNGTLSAQDLVNTLKPLNSHYTALVSVLQRYQDVLRSGQSTAAPAQLATIKAGVTDKSSILYARFRLDLLGYSNDTTKDTLTDDLTQAITDFQKNEKLTADGVLGSGSWKVLNQDFAGQISQLRISIDRSRWLPDNLGATHVFVNLARQQLQLYVNSELSMDFKTINGKLERKTPILFDSMTHFILNPTWTVPQNILLEDKVPMFTTNPQKVLDLRMKVIDDLTDKEVDPFSVDWSKVTENNIPYTLVQKPGKGNALGFIKFPLTNPYSIYLHDTDSRNLFAKNDRMLSSGCVRLEKPFEFAEKVTQSMNMMNWSADTLKDATENLSPEAETSTRVKLVKSIPVYLFYLTADVNEKGQVILSNDNYGIDATTYDIISQK
ncbi:MAG: L,D-transpeptidase family protein [Bdellovibrio sp.]|nr:L,D-transpeptidase family protein [Bdellovibrio sp.]